jgi:hypothetical protein
MELHPLYSPSKSFVGDKRARAEPEEVVAIELDDVESMIREEVLQVLQVWWFSPSLLGVSKNLGRNFQGKKQLCACGELIEPTDMFNAHVLPCPHCGSQKCSDCTALALEVRAKSSCCESCAMACSSCVRKLRLACSDCSLGRRCQVFIIVLFFLLFSHHTLTFSESFF